MLGLLVTLGFCAGASGLGLVAFRRWLEDEDPAARLGMAGALSLGLIGTLTLFLGWLTGGFRWGVFLVGVAGLVGLVCLVREARSGRVPLARPQGTDQLFFVGLGVAVLIAVVGALAPADTLDWDSLAYHLAVPKMWLAAGQSHFISFIHHSNFPFAIDNLYIWGLAWGGESGAKAFSVAYLVLALLTIFGLTRARFGPVAAGWASLAFASIPAVLWLSGTGYIDVSNGLYAGLGLLFAARWLEDRRSQTVVLAGLMLGLAAGSKYTGLQTLFVAGLVFAAGGAILKAPVAGLKAGVVAALLALLVAGPWYVRNAVVTGNPVYPFFYSKLGGINWSEFNERIYRDEQLTFGVGRTESGRDPLQAGHAILGLAYQPGRYTNPSPTQGLGLPFGALGAAILLSGLFWMASGRAKAYEGGVLVGVGLSLGLWFFLSQQSRYIVALSVPLAVLLGGAAVQFAFGRILMAVTVLQTAFSFWLMYTQRVSAQLPVVLGRESRDDYLNRNVGFYTAATRINEKVPPTGRVALYDEVFGYFLDVPYFWANPGHTTEIPYETLADGEALVRRLKELGITHVYLNLAFNERAFRDRMVAAMGLAGSPVPFPADEAEAMRQDPRTKWKLLVAEAAASGRLRLIDQYRVSLLFEVVE